jgi:phosphoribosylaminoimidazolecarboxamide formyltransferase / IMP cyclohydrolase
VRALLSVANRDGIAELAREPAGPRRGGLRHRRHPRGAGGRRHRCRPVSDLTGSQPLAGGQVKTFHPAVYAGILARRNEPDELAELAERASA